MGDHTKIEWSDATWNPVTGCTKVSPGCDHCYVETIAHRFAGTKAYPERLTQPLGWRKPRRVFVNSMSDLFHKDTPDEYIAQVFAVMALAPQHTFQVLTKRPARMRSLLTRPWFPELVTTWAWRINPGKALQLPHGSEAYAYSASATDMPLLNVWLGVSVEDQKRADIRIPVLVETPAAVRFILAEPLLGPVDLSRWTSPSHAPDCQDETGGPPWCTCGRDRDGYLDWVIVGGESGRGARPMHPDWARSLRDECVSAGVPFLFKQWGEWMPTRFIGLGSAETGRKVCVPDSTVVSKYGEGRWLERVGKKIAGRDLDSRTWDEYPSATRVDGDT